LVAAFLFFKKPAPETQSPALENAPEDQRQADIPAGRTLVVPMSAQNNSGESGTATLVEDGGRTNVVIAVSGAPAGIAQPAHIHTGSCATIGGVKYPLNFPVDGKSETMIDVALDTLLGQLPLAINIHKSAAEANIYVACGDIVDPSATSQNAPADNQSKSNVSSDDSDEREDAGPFATPTDKRKGADKPED
jgi:hypothetical protein